MSPGLRQALGRIDGRGAASVRTLHAQLRQANTEAKLAHDEARTAGRKVYERECELKAEFARRTMPRYRAVITRMIPNKDLVNDNAELAVLHEAFALSSA